MSTDNHCFSIITIKLGAIQYYNIKIFVTLQFEATEMILKSKFWWLWSLIQSHWAVQSSARAAQKFCSRCLACPHPLVIVANCAKLRYDISPYLWFLVRSATIYRVFKKKIACPQKQPTLSIFVPGISLPIQSLASSLFLYGNFGNIIMLLLSKQLPHAAAWDKMASTSHYNNTIQKSPFIRLKRCCPDLPHTVIYSHIDTMHFISKGISGTSSKRLAKLFFSSVGQKRPQRNIIAPASRQTLS